MKATFEIPDERRYADEKNSVWCVFGVLSGHCYATYASRSAAEEAADNYNAAD